MKMMLPKIEVGLRKIMHWWK